MRCRLAIPSGPANQPNKMIYFASMSAQKTTTESHVRNRSAKVRRGHPFLFYLLHTCSIRARQQPVRTRECQVNPFLFHDHLHIPNKGKPGMTDRGCMKNRSLGSSPALLISLSLSLPLSRTGLYLISNGRGHRRRDISRGNNMIPTIASLRAFR